MASRFRPEVLPFLLLPVYSMFTAVQACGGTALIATNSDGGGSDGRDGGGSADGSVSDPTCEPNETAKVVNQSNLCCVVGAGAEVVCRDRNVPTPGKSCAGGPPSVGARYWVTFDMCVSDKCTGDRECTEFPQVLREEKGTLKCEGNVWAWDGTPSVHEVRRACLTSGYRYCDNPGELYETTNYGYTPGNIEGSDPAACGKDPYGPDYYVNEKALFLSSSTCSTEGAAPIPCPLDGL